LKLVIIHFYYGYNARIFKIQTFTSDSLNSRAYYITTTVRDQVPTKERFVWACISSILCFVLL